MFQIQIFHPDSGFFLNTNHALEDLETLTSLVAGPAFAGLRCQIVDQDGTVCFGPVVSEWSAETSIEALAQSFGIPVRDPFDVGLVDRASPQETSECDVGYTLQALHEGDGKSIVSFGVEEARGEQIIREVWPLVNFWAAPGGSSVQITSQAQADTINRILGNCWITFEPDRHRWLFHVSAL